MAQPLVVAPVVEVRKKLSAILARFRTEGKAATPLFLGAHRTPEAVLLSYLQYQEIMTELDQLQSYRDREQADMIALASVRDEGQEPTARSESVARDTDPTERDKEPAHAFWGASEERLSCLHAN